MNKDKTGNERYRRWYAAHVEEVNKKRREVYLERKKSGLCPRCGAETGDGGLCNDCLEKARIANEKTH